jgi:glycogen operon protein
MDQGDWDVGYAKSLGVLLNGSAIAEPDRHGRPISDDSFYLVFNGWDQELAFTLPPPRWSASWSVALDTADGRPVDERAGSAGTPLPAGTPVPMLGHHFMLFQQHHDRR